MPNWCNNSLTVKGSPEAIAAFAEKARVHAEDVIVNWERMRKPKTAQLAADGETAYICGCCGDRLTFEQWFELHARKPFTLQAFVPEPADLDPANELRWRSEHWTTTRDVRYEGEDGGYMTRYLTVTPTQLDYRFDTAWCAPVTVITEMLRQHPDLDFTYRATTPWTGDVFVVMRPAGSPTAKLWQGKLDEPISEGQD
jgi:hypothetical protein